MANKQACSKNGQKVTGNTSREGYQQSLNNVNNKNNNISWHGHSTRWEGQGRSVFALSLSRVCLKLNLIMDHDYPSSPINDNTSSRFSTLLFFLLPPSFASFTSSWTPWHQDVSFRLHVSKTLLDPSLSPCYHLCPSPCARERNCCGRRFHRYT